MVVFSILFSLITGVLTSTSFGLSVVGNLRGLVAFEDSLTMDSISDKYFLFFFPRHTATLFSAPASSCLKNSFIISGFKLFQVVLSS